MYRLEIIDSIWIRQRIIISLSMRCDQNTFDLPRQSLDLLCSIRSNVGITNPANCWFESAPKQRNVKMNTMRKSYWRKSRRLSIRGKSTNKKKWNTSARWLWKSSVRWEKIFAWLLIVSLFSGPEEGHHRIKHVTARNIELINAFIKVHQDISVVQRNFQHRKDHFVTRQLPIFVKPLKDATINGGTR